jgi:hypothetical protein
MIALRCRRMPGEGSRPSDLLLTKPGRRFNRGRKYAFVWWHTFAARGDARPPCRAAGFDDEDEYEGHRGA